MTAALPLLLPLLPLLLPLTAARAVLAPRSLAELTAAEATQGLRRLLLDTTQPFVFINGERTNLRSALEGGHPDRLECGLEFEGHLLVLDLEKNQPPSVFYYLPNGTGVFLPTDPLTHCFYHGRVRGFPRSRAAVSTCSGLRGIVALNSTLSFELQPQDKQETGSEREETGSGEEPGSDVHLLFSLEPPKGDSAAGCGVKHTAIPHIHSRIHLERRRRDILTETKYIELVLVVDHQEFLNYQKNNKTIIYRMMDVANQVDWFYRPLNIRVALTGLEIWSDRDKIHIERSPTQTLHNFLEWRATDLLPRLRHDNAQLIMGGSFDGTTVGMASQASMCSRDRSGGVNVDHLVSILGVASTVAHELGHNLGMNHDSAERACQCQNQPRLGGCIMEPSTGLLPGQSFSSCSAEDLSSSLLQGGGMCLFNVPQPQSLLGGPRCGNLYLEPGEDCDCGLLQECEDPCCNALTCRLVPGAECSSDGICCKNCKLQSPGSLCRLPLGECDLPEFCTGSSSHCPPNVFVQNGERCLNGTSYCFGGVCPSLDGQCRTLWGLDASIAPDVCFLSVNKQGNKFGNCGQLPNGSYLPCEDQDVLCGQVQCQGGQERPLLGSNAEILTTTVHSDHTDLVCRGTYFHLGHDVSDPASVATGTACGPGKACLDQKCQDEAVFRVDECRRKCNGHGVCNSNGNCHCDEGWAPPDCRFLGLGGSVDSGPTRPSIAPVRVALLVVFLLLVLVLVLVLVLRWPRFRRLLGLDTSPLHKVRQYNRTPVMEWVEGRNGDQVRPLRYNSHSELPLAPPPTEVSMATGQPHKQVSTATAPYPKEPPVPLKPLVPKKPLPPTPLRCPSNTVTPEAGLNRPAPLPPIRPTMPCRRDSTSPL